MKCVLQGAECNITVGKSNIAREIEVNNRYCHISFFVWEINFKR